MTRRWGVTTAESSTPQSENTSRLQLSGIESLREFVIMLAKSAAVLCIVFVHTLGECRNFTINSLSIDLLVDYIHSYSSVLTTTCPIQSHVSSIPYVCLTEASLHVEQWTKLQPCPHTRWNQHQLEETTLNWQGLITELLVSKHISRSNVTGTCELPSIW